LIGKNRRREIEYKNHQLSLKRPPTNYTQRERVRKRRKKNNTLASGKIWSVLWNESDAFKKIKQIKQLRINSTKKKEFKPKKLIVRNVIHVWYLVEISLENERDSLRESDVTEIIDTGGCYCVTYDVYIWKHTTGKRCVQESSVHLENEKEGMTTKAKTKTTTMRKEKENYQVAFTSHKIMAIISFKNHFFVLFWCFC
jgi:hypothetical protein